MWCPEGVLPGGAGCTTNFASISALITNMVSHTSNYTQNGVIYFTSNPGAGTFTLNPTTLSGGDFDTLKNYNLTLKGGWNGDSVSPSFSGQTDFSNHPITIGTSANPWVGNITLIDFTFTGASQTSLTVYTTSGGITLNNVDVNNQANGNNPALLNTTSGDITITDGTFDGNNSNSAGLSATTGSGSITITDSFFTENKKPTPANTSDGATLSAPIVTLTNVTSTGNDGNGITINNANVVTLNNVTASNNGTDITPVGFTNNIGSGVFFNGNVGSKLIINGGMFNNNQRYGIELANPANTTIQIHSAPTCTGNDSNTAPINSCSNATFVTDTTPPTLNLPADITVSIPSSTGTIVTYSASATDNVDPSVSVACAPVSGSNFAVGTTIVGCFAIDTAGNAALGSFQVTVVDTTPAPPTPTPSPAPSPAPLSTGSISGTSASFSPIIIPVTSGKAIRLDCNSAFWAFGIKLSFTSLCDYQATLNSINANNLPGPLPNDSTFVLGLNLSIMKDNQVIENLPSGSGIQMDFPALGGSQDQFAVLYWNGSEWIEVSPQPSSDDNFYQVSTTDKTGIFVLVKK
jgi:hypothetical protein